MNAVVRALFDDAAITGAQAAGLKDTSTAAMRAAVREWFELFFMREAVKGKDEDPAQRIPYTITNKLTKACFAEYDSSFTENGTGKTAWLDGDGDYCRRFGQYDDRLLVIHEFFDSHTQRTPGRGLTLYMGRMGNRTG